MRFDESLHDVEAEPGAADVARRRRRDALKLLEQLRDVLGRDAESAVLDVDLDLVADRTGRDADGRPIGGVLDRVVDEVDEDLFELRAIDADEREVGRDVDEDAARPPLGMELAHEVAHHVVDGDLGPLDAHALRVDARHLEEVVDQPCQPFRLFVDRGQELAPRLGGQLLVL